MKPGNMNIVWHGHAFFQIMTARSKEEKLTLAIDPFSEEVGLKAPSVEADILLVSHDHYDHNNLKAIKGRPFLIQGPGEYEIKEVFIQGIAAYHDKSQGKERGRVTIYTIETEGARLCHLGDFGQKELTSEQIEKIGDCDILMIPVGGVYTISGPEAAKIISQIEPKIVIPMHYQLPKLKLKLESLDKFLKAMGQKGTLPQPKLSLKAKDLPQEETKIIVLKP
jgi:L-ascorbate metabolism protein UlaG (beta-lactamase superfamily)